MADVNEELPAATRIGRVALRVNDLERMDAFYREVVGLERHHAERGRVTLGDGDEVLLELVDAPDAPPRQRDETGLFHTAFRVPSRASLAGALARVEEYWQLSGASDHLVSEALYLSDPEDNGIEIYRDRPRSDWPRADDGRIKLDTLSLDLTDLRAESDESETVPPETTVGHVHLEVSSLPVAREWYVDGLGMRLQSEYPGALFVAAGDYHHHVGLNTWNKRTSPSSGRGLTWFEFLLPDSEALEATRERLVRHGIEPERRGDGFEVVDSDAITLRFRIDGTSTRD